jgi:2-haloacid dehalogenase
MTRRPLVVLFDVVETLLSLDPVAEQLDPLGIPRELFFARLLRDGFAHAAAGTYQPFANLAEATVTAVASDATAAQREAVLDAFNELPAHRDAEPALAALADAGIEIHTLTNGGADATDRLLTRSGLRRYIGRVLSVEDVSRWKPAPAAYRYAIGALGADPIDAALVAVHAWDIHGASRIGLTTGWCSRLEGSFPSVFDAPTVTGGDLSDVVDALLALDPE